MTSENLVYDKFLSEIIQRCSYKLNVLPFSNKIDKGDAEFIYTKNSSTDFIVHKRLSKLEFNIVDINVIFRRKFVEQDSLLSQQNIRLALKDDEDTVRKIAYKSFVFDRFHKDDGVSNTLASKLKEEWVGNFFRGKRGDSMLIAEVKESVVGFVLMLEQENTIIIDLIAVDENYRKMSVGKNLVQEAFVRYYDGRKDFIVGTQITNINSLNFYQKLGFYIYKTEFVWHWHKS